MVGSSFKAISYAGPVVEAATPGASMLGLDATPTGSAGTNDVVLDFTGGALVQQNLDVSTGTVNRTVDVVNSQTLGTTFKITRGGIYYVELGLVLAASTNTVHAGISMDALAAELATDPVFNYNTMLSAGRNVGVAGLVNTLKLSTVMRVTETAAADPTRAIVRGHASDGSGAGVAAATLTLAACYLQIRRLASYDA